MLTVRGLVEIPHLRLSLYGGEHGLAREISWVHISDLPNPWAWLGDGELLLTNGLNLPREGSAQVSFLDALHAAGVSGMAVGTDMPAPSLRPELKQRADELELAVLLVPYSIPFSAIVRAAADANASEESQRLTRIARLYELLRMSVAAGEPKRNVFRHLETELSCRFSLVDPELGRPLLNRDTRTPMSAALAAEYENHEGVLPGVLHLHDATTRAFAVAVPGDQPAALVVEPKGDVSPDLDLLQHVATLGALVLTDLRAEQETRRRRGAELLAHLIDGQIDPMLATRQLSEAGLSIGSCLLLAVKRHGPNKRDEAVHHQFARHGIPNVLLQRGEVLYAMIPCDEACLREAQSLLESNRYAVGGSAAIGLVEGVPEAAREALWALGVAETEGRTAVRFADETRLFVPRTPEEAHVIVARILGPLLSYDTDHSSQLLHTLRVTLRNNGSWRTAASDLQVHKQTLGYRLRKIEQLTQRSLKSTEDTAELWFAMRAFDLTQGRPADPS